MSLVFLLLCGSTVTVVGNVMGEENEEAILNSEAKRSLTGSFLSTDRRIYRSHFVIREEIEAMKSRIGVREPNKNYNMIIDGHGTGLAPPTEQQWEATIGRLKIVDSVQRGLERLQDGPLGNSSVDLMEDPCFPQVRSQGGEGSCASWSTGYYANGYLQAKDEGWTDASTGNNDHLMSADWVYHKVNGGADSGSDLASPMAVVSTVGNCPESYMPYSQSDHTSWGDEDAWRQAPKYRAKSYEATSVTNIDIIKSWLDEGCAIPMALNAGRYSAGWADGNGIMSWAEFSPEGTPNHANTVVGYNDSITDDGETGAFKIVNSWGASWGPYSNGTYYMTYDCFKNLSWSLCYRYIDKIDYEPSLLGVWNLNPQGARSASIELGVGPYGSPEETRAPEWNGGSYDFPSFMCLDITEFQDNWDAGTNISYLKIGSGSSSSTITSFKIEYYQGNYTPGSPTVTSRESSDTPETTPGYVTVSFILSEGYVQFDNMAYQSNDIATITLMDWDLNTNPTIAETYIIDNVSSAPTGDWENTTILLNETDVNTGRFVGTVQLQIDAANPNNGSLEVANGDTITVRYTDANNGTGNPDTVIDTALVDDSPPIISSVTATPSYMTAVIIWATNEDSNSNVNYGTTTPPTLSNSDLTMTITHSITFTGLSTNTTYYYDVQSTDYAGNTVIDNNGSAYYTFTTLPSENVTWFDDMESGPDFWTNETNGAGTEWQLGYPAGFGPDNACSGTYCWGTNIDTNYTNYADAWLITPPINLTSPVTANLTFWNWYDIEKNWDIGVVEISTDLGTTWTRITPVGGYPDQTNNFGDGYSSMSGGWVSGTEEKFDLSPYLGNIVLIGFHFESDTYVTNSGWYIDDVTIGDTYIPMGVRIAPSSQSQRGMPGTNVSYTLRVTNIGTSGSDIFDITAFSPSGWTINFYESDGITPLGDANFNGTPDTGSLPASGDYKDMIINVSIPGTVVNGTADTVTITATSDNKSSVFDNATITITVPYIESLWPISQPTPTIDGNISIDEWDDAQIVDISSSSVPPGSVTMYVKNNGTLLYIAINDTSDLSLDPDDRIGIYFDDNHDHAWPPTSSPTGEGNFWVKWDGATVVCQYRRIYGDPPNDGGTDTAVGVVGNISNTSGNVQYEVCIDLTTSALQSTPGDTIGIFVYSEDAGLSVSTGDWPPGGMATSIDPSTYGDLTLAQDIIPPTSSVNTIPSYWQTTTPFTITATADDTFSGVARVELFYRFSTDNVTWGGIWTSVEVDTLSPWEWDFYFPGGDGYYEFYSNATDNATNEEVETGTDAICGYDATPPRELSIIINGGDTHTNSTTVILTLSATDLIHDVWQMRFSDDNITWTDWKVYSTSTTYVIPSGDGVKTIYFKARDNLGNEASAVNDTIILDSPPTTTYAISGSAGANGWYIGDVEVNLTAIDIISNVEFTKYRVDGGSWITYIGDFIVSGDGSHTVYFYSKDDVGYQEEMKNITFKIDSVNPSTSDEVTGTVGNDQWYVSSISIVLDGIDETSGIDTMMYRTGGRTWQTYSGEIVITTGGTHIIEYYSVDLAGNTETTKMLTVKVDKTLPSVSLSVENGKTYVNSGSVVLNINAYDNTSGLWQMSFSNDTINWTNWEPYNITKPWALLPGDGVKKIYLMVIDKAGLISTEVNDTIILDTTPSIIKYFTINNGAPYTNSTYVSLSISAYDTTSGINLMNFSNDGISWSPWETYATSKTWKLTNGDGNKTVYVRIKDRAGNVASTISNIIILDTTSPIVLSTIPQNNAANVSIDSIIVITFNATLNNNTLTPINITITDSKSNLISGTMSYDNKNKTITFKPSTTLGYDDQYIVTITTSVKDLAGNGLVENYTFEFTTKTEWQDTDGDGVWDNADDDDDGDNFLDEWEVFLGTDPNDNKSYPVDTDYDGIPDGDENNTESWMDPDDDNDGYSDSEELEAGTDPLDINNYPTKKRTTPEKLDHLIIILIVISIIIIVLIAIIIIIIMKPKRAEKLKEVKKKPREMRKELRKKKKRARRISKPPKKKELKIEELVEWDDEEEFAAGDVEPEIEDWD